jgi:hypothetical protein
MLVLLVAVAMALVAGQSLPPVNCIFECSRMRQETLSYCSGLVSYSSCLSPRDYSGDPTDGSLADERALNNSRLMPRFAESCACVEAQRVLLCSLLFPKCAATASGPTLSQPVCLNTCTNFFARCDVALTTQCQFTEGTGPSDNCTGGLQQCPEVTAAPGVTDVTLEVTFLVHSAVQEQYALLMKAVVGLAQQSSLSQFDIASLPSSSNATANFRLQGVDAAAAAILVVTHTSADPYFFQQYQTGLPPVNSASAAPYVGGTRRVRVVVA